MKLPHPSHSLFSYTPSLSIPPSAQIEKIVLNIHESRKDRMVVVGAPIRQTEKTRKKIR